MNFWPFTKKKQPKYFCPVPWQKLEINSDGAFRPCCRFTGRLHKDDGSLFKHPEDHLEVVWNSKSVQSLRDRIADGEKLAECHQCWNEELVSGRSLRTDSISRLAKNETFRFFRENEAELTPTTLEIHLSNKCNFKCRICGPTASSLHEEEVQKFEDPNFSIDHKDILNESNSEVIKKWLPKINRIEVFGGEPFVNPEFFKLIELCCKFGHPENMVFHLNTNASIFPARYLDLLSKFKQLSIHFSIDDIEERFHYQRYPGDWKVIKDNLEKFQSIQSEKTLFVINKTVSVFNVFYIPEYMQWANEINFPGHFNILHSPNYYSIRNLPAEVKQVVVEKLNSYEKEIAHSKFETLDRVTGYLQLPSEGNYYQDFVNEIKRLDNYRGQSFKNVFPEMANLLNF